MRKLILLFALVGMQMFAYAQADGVRKHKGRKRQSHTGTNKQLSPEEKKKAAVKRTLKEKNFHMPDTTARHRAAK